MKYYTAFNVHSKKDISGYCITLN